MVWSCFLGLVFTLEAVEKQSTCLWPVCTLSHHCLRYCHTVKVMYRDSAKMASTVFSQSPALLCFIKHPQTRGQTMSWMFTLHCLYNSSLIWVSAKCSRAEILDQLKFSTLGKSKNFLWSPWYYEMTGGHSNNSALVTWDVTDTRALKVHHFYISTRQQKWW